MSLGDSALFKLLVGLVIPPICVAVLLAIIKRSVSSWVFGDHFFRLRDTPASAALGRSVAELCLPFVARICLVTVVAIQQLYAATEHYIEDDPSLHDCNRVSAAETASANTCVARQAGQIDFDSFVVSAWSLICWLSWLAAHKQLLIPAASRGRWGYVQLCLQAAGSSVISALQSEMHGVQQTAWVHPLVRPFQAMFVVATLESTLSAVLLGINFVLSAAAGFIVLSVAEWAARQAVFNRTLRTQVVRRWQKMPIYNCLFASRLGKSAGKLWGLTGLTQATAEACFCMVFCLWTLGSMASLQLLVRPIAMRVTQLVSLPEPQSAQQAAAAVSHLVRWPLLLVSIVQGARLLLAAHDALRVFLTKIPLLHASISWIRPPPMETSVASPPQSAACGHGEAAPAAELSGAGPGLTPATDHSQAHHAAPPPQFSMSTMLRVSPMWQTYSKVLRIMEKSLAAPSALNAADTADAHRGSEMNRNEKEADHGHKTTDDDPHEKVHLFPHLTQVLLPPVVTHFWSVASATLSSPAVSRAVAKVSLSLQSAIQGWQPRGNHTNAQPEFQTSRIDSIRGALAHGPVGSFVNRLQLTATSAGIAQALLQLSAEALKLVNGLSERLGGLNYLLTHAAHQTSIRFGIVFGPARVASGTFGGLDLTHTQLEISAFSRTTLWNIVPMPRTLWGEHTLVTARLLGCTPGAPVHRELLPEQRPRNSFSSSTILGVLPIMASNADFFSSRLLLDVAVNQHFVLAALAAVEYRCGNVVSAVVAQAADRLGSITGIFHQPEANRQRDLVDRSALFVSTYRWHIQQWLDLHRRSSQAASYNVASLQTAAAAVAGFNLREYNERWLSDIMESIFQNKQGVVEADASVGAGLLGVLGRRPARHGADSSLRNSQELTLAPHLLKLSAYSGRLLALVDVLQGLIGLPLQSGGGSRLRHKSEAGQSRPAVAKAKTPDSHEADGSSTEQLHTNGIRFGVYSDLVWPGTMQPQSQLVDFDRVLPNDPPHDGDAAAADSLSQSQLQTACTGFHSKAYQIVELSPFVQWLLWCWHLVVDAVSTVFRGRAALSLAVSPPLYFAPSEARPTILQSLLPVEQQVMSPGTSVSSCGASPFDMLGGSARAHWLPGLLGLYQPWLDENTSLNAETGHCDESVITQATDENGVMQRTTWSAATELRRSAYCEELLRSGIEGQVGQHTTATRTLQAHSSVWNVGAGDAVSLHEAAAVATEVFGSPPITVSMKATSTPNIHKAKAQLAKGGTLGILRLAGSGAGYVDSTPVRRAGCHWAFGPWAASSACVHRNCLKWCLNADLLAERFLRACCSPPAVHLQRPAGSAASSESAFEPNVLGARGGLPVEVALTFAEGDFMMRLPLATQHRSKQGVEAWSGLLPVMGGIVFEWAVQLCEEQQLPLQLPTSIAEALDVAAGWSAGKVFRLELAGHLSALEAWRRRTLWRRVLQPLVAGKPRLTAMLAVVLGAMNKSESRLAKRLLTEAGVPTTDDDLAPTPDSSQLEHEEGDVPHLPGLAAPPLVRMGSQSSTSTAYTDDTMGTMDSNFLGSPSLTRQSSTAAAYQHQIEESSGLDRVDFGVFPQQERSDTGAAAGNDDAVKPLWDWLLELLPESLRGWLLSVRSAVETAWEVAQASLQWAPALGRLYDLQLLGEMNTLTDILFSGLANLEDGLAASGDTHQAQQAADIVNALCSFDESGEAQHAADDSRAPSHHPQGTHTGATPSGQDTAASAPEQETAGWLKSLLSVFLLPMSAAGWCLSHMLTSVILLELIWRSTMCTLMLVTAQVAPVQRGPRRTATAPVVLWVPPKPRPVRKLAEENDCNTQEGGTAALSPFEEECARLMCDGSESAGAFESSSGLAMSRLLDLSDVELQPLAGTAAVQSASVILACHAMHRLVQPIQCTHSPASSQSDPASSPGEHEVDDEQSEIAEDDGWL